MGNTWFRMYNEFAFDPKVQMLSEQDQRRFVMLLCLKSCNVTETLQDEDVTFQLRICNDEWKKTKALFLSKKLIDENNSPTNWGKRQFISDSSKGRVARHRERKKLEKSSGNKLDDKIKKNSNGDVTLQSRRCNAIDTDTDTDTDTDIEITNVISSCSEPKSSEQKKQPKMDSQENDSGSAGKLPAEKQKTVVIELPLNMTGTYHEVTQESVDEWANLYPAVNVMQELRNILGWLNSNPSKRKTKSGVNRFINSWLARKQDKGSGNGQVSRTRNGVSDFELNNTNF